ncbi:TetR/AcrR family transcriptional regulator [Diaphorobacter aerolatus]|uniref:TetR/AcrR family transcriptional regulator n=1 Tax=Diaphorobacter aerolatus TaxID=1288495 RepID=A0A7H0GI17_9BURK|nr:TetR/AcrR family transcriptional regulator [Diaphorobacter aerolatus]QNP47933.1 TetR/AcrR family transcriptional regulator [Diaphorobacter aerolatus]
MTTEASSRKRGEKHGDLRAALIAAALDVLERVGPERLSLREVARLAGVSQAAPYNHFADREAILAELAALGFQLLTERQDSAPSLCLDDQSMLEQLGVAYVRFACDKPALYRLMFGAGVNGQGWHAYPTVSKAKSQSFMPVRNVVGRLIARPDAVGKNDDAAMVCWAVVHGISMLLIDGTLTQRVTSAAEADDMTRRSIAVLLNGLGPVHPTHGVA